MRNQSGESLNLCIVQSLHNIFLTNNYTLCVYSYLFKKLLCEDCEQYINLLDPQHDAEIQSGESVSRPRLEPDTSDT
jgi:hypothetical protein